MVGNTEWKAEWIRLGWNPVVPCLRKAFEVDKPLASATLRATALGVYELMLNGWRVGGEVLQPGWTDYRKRVYYFEHDLTDLLKEGGNMLGAMVAPGWYAGFCGPFEDKGFYGQEAYFSCELVLAYEDGTTETLVTDSSWEGHPGPLLSSDLLMGESYDARLEIDDWTMPGQVSGDWKPVVVLEEPISAGIEPYPGAPVTEVEELPALSVTSLPNGASVFDLGQNMVGVVRLRLNVPCDTELVLRHGEMLNEDGSVYTGNLRSAKATDRYIAKGGKDETWQPRFTFHGFRYVQIEGLPGTPDLGTVTGVVLSSIQKPAASFECSDPKVNQLFGNIERGFRGNYLDIPTDCPQRDERLGWTGDTQMFIRSATYLADIRSFYKKWLVDLNDAQHPDGGYPDVAPWMGRLGHASAGWADAGIICPHVLWQAYGELDFIRPWWPQMKKFMALICTGENRHNGPDADSFGDWLHINSETPTRLIGLAYRAYDARLMAEMAGALGEAADQIFFEAEAQKSRALFRDAFFDGGEVVVQTQTACALAIAKELLVGEDLEKAGECLVQCLEQSKGYLTTGFVGTGYICPALTKVGRGDLAVQLLLNEEYPSWLYEVNNGATTIWERWNSWTEEAGFGDEGMNSFNHYAFGAVCEWMLGSLAGIKPGAPGFQTVDIEPGLTDRFDYVKASYESIHGRISIHWKKTANGFEIKLETPVGTTVHLPSGVQNVGKGIHKFEETR